MRTKRDALRLWVSLGLYAASFFLVAAQSTEQGKPATLRGYLCALDALIIPSEFLLENLVHQPVALKSASLDIFSLFMSGWINPIFLAYVVLFFRRASNWVLITLKITLVLMIPFCWLFLYFGHLRPREGHFLWILAMLLFLAWHRSGSPSPAPA